MCLWEWERGSQGEVVRVQWVPHETQSLFFFCLNLPFVHLSQPKAPVYITPTRLPPLSHTHRHTHTLTHTIKKSCKLRGLVWFWFLFFFPPWKNLEQKDSKNLYSYMCGQRWDSRKEDEWLDEQIVITVA